MIKSKNKYNYTGEKIMVTKQQFGILSDNTEITKYTITNCKGEYVELLDSGATLHGLFLKDRNGSLDNCVLQVSSPDELRGKNMAGCVIGRCANRIGYGRFLINGKEIQLETNSGKHFIHGASGNYARRMFSAEIADEQSVIFRLEDNGEGGFGNIVHVKVIYRFDDDSCLTISYELTPEDATVLCPTNHAYFNLGGLSDIRESLLKINSGFISETDSEGIPVGKLLSVANSPFDFRHERKISEAMQSDRDGLLEKTKYGYDNAYYFPDKGMSEKAVLYCPDTGRELTVISDAEGMMLFTPGNCRGKKSGGTVIDTDYAAVCLETQFMPNAVNCPAFTSPIFQAGEKMVSETKFIFKVR